MFKNPSTSLKSIGEEEEQENNVSSLTEFESHDLQSYVAWFTNLDSLANHILSNISENFKEDEFTFNCLKITHQIYTKPSAIPQQNWFNFSLINPGHWIIRATISQNNHIFVKNNRNYQDVGNSVVALYLASVCEPEDWNSIVLDVILKYGDRLYTKSYLKDKKLNLNQIANPFIINRIRIGFSVVKSFSGDLTVPVGNIIVKSLEDCLKEFFDNSNGLGILETRDFFVSIWKQKESFFLFDPHEIGPDGRKEVNGVSCLSRFDKLKEMGDYFLKNLMECDLGFNKFKIHSVRHIIYDDLLFFF